MFRQILVSVDGSEHARQALSEAIDLAEAGGARLTIITAVAQPPPWSFTAVTAPAAQEIARSLEREAKEALRSATELVPGDIPVTSILTRDPIRSALLAQAKTGRTTCS
jgi:nucleotide-binding universal stress UspA family protein